MKNFQKKLTKTTTTAQFLPFFPFFLSMFQQKTKHKFLLPARVWTNNWMNHIKYYQTNEREIEHVRFAAWQVFNKNAKKKIPKKRLISCLSLRSLKIFMSNPDSFLKKYLNRYMLFLVLNRKIWIDNSLEQGFGMPRVQ